jgi:hypothetical protein
LAASNAIGSGGGGSQTVSSASIRTTVVCIEGAGDKLPSEVVIDYEDWNQQTSQIKARGAFSDLLLWDESDDAVTLTEYTNITLRADGREVLNNVRTSLLVHDFNDKNCAGGTQDNESEQLPTTGNLLFLPVLSPAMNYKSSQLTEADESLRVDFSGSATAAKWCYRKIVDSDESAIGDAMRAMGVKDPSRAALESSTIKGNELQGEPRRVARLERRLPKRFRRVV